MNILIVKLPTNLFLLKCNSYYQNTYICQTFFYKFQTNKTQIREINLYQEIYIKKLNIFLIREKLIKKENNN